MQARRTVLIVDDHEGFRNAARELIEAAGFVVIGEAVSGEEGLLAAAALQPDVVLLDIQLQGLDGFHVADRLAREAEPPAVVLLSIRDAAAYGSRLSQTPARGFITKAALSGDALAALVG